MQGPACPGLYLPLVPPAQLVCSGAAQCVESSGAAHGAHGAWGTPALEQQRPGSAQGAQLLPGVQGIRHGQGAQGAASWWGRIHIGISSDDLSNSKTWSSKRQAGPWHPTAIRRRWASWERYRCGGEGEEREMMESFAWPEGTQKVTFARLK